MNDRSGLDIKAQVLEWRRAVGLAAAHLSVARKLHEVKTLDVNKEVWGPFEAFLELTYHAHRNGLIINLHAALDTHRSTIKVADLLKRYPESLASAANRELSQIDPKVRAGVKQVRDKTAGHRSRSHSNRTAWATAGLTFDLLSEMIVHLEAVSDLLGAHDGSGPLIMAMGAADQLGEMLLFIIEGAARA